MDQQTGSVGGRSRVLAISFTDLASDPRVDRQIEMLRHEHEVVCAGTAPPADGDLEFIDLTMPPRSAAGRATGAARLLTRRYDAVYWTHPHNRAALERLAGVRPDLVVANDLSALPLACALPGAPPVLFDSHEYAPAEQADQLTWRLVMAPYMRALLRRYLPHVAAMMTVAPGIAELYEREFGLPCAVVTNAPRHHPELVPTPVSAPVRLLHHGAAQRSRRIETAMDVFERLEPGRFTLELVLAENTPGYRDELAARAATLDGVQVLPARPMRELVAAANAYDVGLYLLPPASANQRLALPNKLFEFIQARLCVAIGPSEEMARVVREWDCGIVADDFDPATLAGRLNAMTAEDIARAKAAAHRAAPELSFERNRATLLELIERCLNKA